MVMRMSKVIVLNCSVAGPVFTSTTHCARKSFENYTAKEHLEIQLTLT